MPATSTIPKPPAMPSAPEPAAPDSLLLLAAREKALAIMTQAGRQDDAAIREDIERLTAIVDGCQAKLAAISDNLMLSDKGKATQAAEQRANAQKTVDFVVEAKGLDAEEQRLRATMVNNLVQQRDRRTPSDKVLAHLAATDMRRELIRLEDEARRTHESKLAAQGALMNDEERRFRSPVIDIVKQAIQDYREDDQNELIIKAALDGPTPFRLINGDKRQELLALLERKISPNEAERLDYLGPYRRALQALVDGVKVALTDPAERKGTSHHYNPALRPLQ